VHRECTFDVYPRVLAAQEEYGFTCTHDSFPGAAIDCRPRLTEYVSVEFKVPRRRGCSLARSLQRSRTHKSRIIRGKFNTICFA
jgi:hypothetical protein